MKIIVHKGTHDIGGTCVEIAAGSSRIIVDIGIPLQENGEAFNFRKYRHIVGQELVRQGRLPDVKGLYKWDKGSKPVDAILISHSHLDHYGYLPYVNPAIPIFASRGCKELMGIAYYFGQSDHDPRRVIVKRPWAYFDDVPGFAVRPYLVDHSAPDAFAYLIKPKAGGKRIFYSGDFRGHGKKKVLFEKMVKDPPRDIDILMLEGTTVGSARDGEQASELEIEQALAKLFDKTNRLIVFSCSHQNVDRLTALYNACLRSGKTLVMIPYTAYVLLRLRILSAKIPQFYMSRVRVFFEKTRNTEKALSDKRLMLAMRKRKIQYPEIAASAKNVVVLDSYFVRKHFLTRGLLDKALVVYSKWHGYLESEEPFWKACRVPVKEIHSSGHASVDELKELVAAMDPARIIPIHTQDPRKFRDYFGDRVMDVSDGQAIEL